MIQKFSCEDDDFMHLLEEFMSKVNDEGLELVATVLRRIWLQRNKFIFGGEFVHPARLVRSAKESVEEYHKALTTDNNKVRSIQHNTVSVWKRPSCGVVKVNWDAAVDKIKNIMGVGLVARDYNGKVLACRCSFRPNILDPTVAEAVAVWMTADLCRTMELQNVELVGDSLVEVQALMKEDSNWNRYGQLIEDAKIILNCMQHVQREANSVAHRLAKEAGHHSLEKNMDGLCPMLYSRSCTC